MKMLSLIPLVTLALFGAACAPSPPLSPKGLETKNSLALAVSKTTVQTACGGFKDTFCTTIPLQSGAKLKPFLFSSPLQGGGPGCRGWWNKFVEKSVKDATTSAIQNEGLTLSSSKIVISGSFHDDYGSPAFPLKIAGWKATYGYECRPLGGANNLRMLSIRNSAGRAFIEPFDLQKLNSLDTAPEVVVGLDPLFNKSASTMTGRNFVGLKSPYNGGYGMIVFLTSKALDSSSAIKVLENQGVSRSQMMQLDGSTVAQISLKNSDDTWSHPIQNARGQPQVFGIFE
jgi:hypothetical protein